MRQLFQPTAAFVYCHRQAAAGRCRRCKPGGNYPAPAGACATERTVNSAHGQNSAKIILFHFIS